MKFKSSKLLALATLISCSTTHVAYNDPEVAKAEIKRSVANVKETKDFSKSIEQLTKGIYHSYLYGQQLLEKYDQELDRDPVKAMEGDTYSELLAVRTFVDTFEEKMNDLYVHLVMVSAMPEHHALEKAQAREALGQIGQFLDGVLSDGKELPENLRPLVLASLSEKQAQVYDLLKAVDADLATDPASHESRKVIKDNMILLRSTRRTYTQNLSSYEVDHSSLDSAVAAAAKDKDFNQFKKDVKLVSKDIKKLIKEVRAGRSTSGDVIYPATGAAGNITGRGFPANTWSLTYDDGPASKNTSQVLANLKSMGYKATFFVLAKQVEALPTITKSLVDAGMDMASHSYTHAQITKLGAQGQHREIVTSKHVIEQKTGKKVKLFRLPYGAGVSNTAIRQTIAGADMVHVFWNVDTLDWQDKNPQSIYQRAVKQMSAYKGGVILFHDIHPQTVTASKLLMDHMKRSGINVCTVQGVVDQQNKNLPSCN